MLTLVAPILRKAFLAYMLCDKINNSADCMEVTAELVVHMPFTIHDTYIKLKMQPDANKKIL